MRKHGGIDLPIAVAAEVERQTACSPEESRAQQCRTEPHVGEEQIEVPLRDSPHRFVDRGELRAHLDADGMELPLEHEHHALVSLFGKEERQRRVVARHIDWRRVEREPRQC